MSYPGLDFPLSKMGVSESSGFRLSGRYLGAEQGGRGNSLCSFTQSSSTHLHHIMGYAEDLRRFPGLKNKTFSPLHWVMSKHLSGCAVLMLKTTRGWECTKDTLPVDQSHSLTC